MSSLLFRDRPAPVLERNVRLPIGVDQYAILRGSSAVSVTTETAMRHDAVWSCRTRIAEDVSMLPVDVVRYVGGTRQEAQAPQIVTAPSAFTSAMDWRYQVIMAWTGVGNAWGLVTQTTPDSRYPTRIELKDQDESIRVVQIGNDLHFYVDGVEHDLWPVGDLWHAPAYTVPGRLLGLSPIQHHATSIGKGMAAGLHGFQYFSDGAHPTHIAKVKGADETAATAFKDRLMALMRGNREPLVVNGDEVDIVKLQSDPEDSQFLETERYSVEQVCRIYNCDPADHGSSAGGSSVTYANRADAHFARMERRQYWITKLQDVLTGMLPRPQVVRLNTNATLMMTPRERAEVDKLRLESKTLAVNEVRKHNDEEPFGPEYDQPGIPAAAGAAPVTEGNAA